MLTYGKKNYMSKEFNKEWLAWKNKKREGELWKERRTDAQN